MQHTYTTKKFCSSCKKTKPISEFSGRTGYQKGMLLAFCKGCVNERSNKWKKDNKERVDFYQKEYRRKKHAN